MTVLGDDGAGGQALAQNVHDGGGHRHGGFPTPDDEHALIVAQVVAAAGDDEHIPLAPDMMAHGGRRFDGGQRGPLQFGGHSVQIVYRRHFIPPDS